MALIDLTNQKFERLTVLYRDFEAEKLRKGRHAMWFCQCDCGNTVSVVGKDLRQGKTKSCGCLQKEKTSQANSNNLIGKRYGNLVVISQEKSKNQRTYWKCKCDCGNYTVKCSRDLQAGDTNSCGCLVSKGEAKIRSILNNLSFDFKEQYTFKNFTTIENIPFRFDFAIFKNNQLYCLIEYDGIQHFKTGDGWNNEESLKRNKYNDNLKNQYCEKNNIVLIRIPYFDFNILNEDYIKERIGEKCIADIQ